MPCHSPIGQCPLLQCPCTLPKVGKQRCLGGAGRGKSRETGQGAWQAPSHAQEPDRTTGVRRSRETLATPEPATDGWDEWGDLTGMAPRGPDTDDAGGERQSAEPQAMDTNSSSLGLHGEEIDFITGQRYSQAQVRGHTPGAQAAALDRFHAWCSGGSAGSVPRLRFRTHAAVKHAGLYQPSQVPQEAESRCRACLWNARPQM